MTNRMPVNNVVNSSSFIAFTVLTSRRLAVRTLLYFQYRIQLTSCVLHLRLHTCTRLTRRLLLLAALPNAHLLFLLALIEKYTDYGICTLLRTLHREDPPATVHDLYKYRPQCTLCTCTRHVAMFCGSATPTRTAVAYCLL